MKLNKGAVDLTDLAIGILVLGVVVSVGATILVGMRDSRLTDLTTVYTRNESVTPTDAGVQLSNVWVKGIIQVVNSTKAIDSANYTLTVDSNNGVGTLKNLTSEFVDKAWNVSYSRYDTTRADWALSNNASVGLAEYGNWFKIIVIVGVAAVVLSLIFMAFGRNNQGGTTY